MLAAGQTGSPESDRALDALCSTYWYPLYAYARRWGLDAETAADRTQGFFARLLEREDLRGVDPERGRVRAFLLACMRNFLAGERQREGARKRGGGRAALSLDAAEAERRYRLEPAHEETAEALYRRRWALALLDEVLVRLKEDYAARGKERLFEALKGTLTSSNEESYQEVGRRLGLSEGAVKVAVHRLRRRYGEAVRAEIARTVESSEEIDDEIERLFEALGT